LKIESDRINQIKYFLKKHKLPYHKIALYDLALSHKSYLNENKQHNKDNEKMEFLGDSILGFVTTEFLFSNFPDKSEGELAKIKSYVVSEKSLSVIAREIQLHEYILVGKGEEQSGGRTKDTILCDCFEAFIAACYLDNGIIKTKEFILHYIKPEIEKTVQNEHEKDYKSLLQELIQKNHKLCPQYKTESESGPEHNKIFTVNVFVEEKFIGQGAGRSKKDAEQNAAKNAYKKLNAKIVRS